MHASCAARGGGAVLLTGPSGSGKSDLALRLLGIGFTLVADDRVDIVDGCAAPPPALAGLLEVRGLGIVRIAHAAPVRLLLTVRLSGSELAGRMPHPARHAQLDLPMIAVDPAAASAPERVAMALACLTGGAAMVAGAFGPQAGS